MGWGYIFWLGALKIVSLKKFEDFLYKECKLEQLNIKVEAKKFNNFPISFNIKYQSSLCDATLHLLYIKFKYKKIWLTSFKHHPKM